MTHFSKPRLELSRAVPVRVLKPLPAIAATERHGLVLGSGLNAARAAIDAVNAVRPASFNEPLLGGRGIGEHLD